MNIRLIPRLDIKGPHLIKGVQLEGLRKVGDPQEFARRYYEAGADELIYMDAVASLYGRNSLAELVQRTVEDVFIPITVGGGIRSVEDAHTLLHAGADKVAVNTAAIARPELITELAQHFGSQCVVLSVEAKQTGNGSWEAYTDNGRERTGRDLLEWISEAVALGAGEILLTSVDREGTRKGFDLELLKAVTLAVQVPVIASGGMGTAEHLHEAVKAADISAVAMADILHWQRDSLESIRKSARENGIEVRQP